MFLMRFTERAYVNYTEEDVRNSPNSAVRLTFSNSHFDPQVGADLYNMYLDEYQYSEEMGFDGLMLNEHHNTPTSLGATMNLEAYQEAQDRAPGQPAAHIRQPIRLAEELAMIDMISRGRLVSGFVRGTGVESLATNTNPLHNRERFEEATTCSSRPGLPPGPSAGRGSTTSFAWLTPLRCPCRNLTLPSGFPAPAARRPWCGAPSTTTLTFTWKPTLRAPGT